MIHQKYRIIKLIRWASGRDADKVEKRKETGGNQQERERERAFQYKYICMCMCMCLCMFVNDMI